MRPRNGRAPVVFVFVFVFVFVVVFVVVVVWTAHEVRGAQVSGHSRRRRLRSSAQRSSR